MFTISTSYLFPGTLNTIGLPIPQIEDLLSDFIFEYLEDGDLIGVGQYEGKGYRDFSEFAHFNPSSVFIEFIFSIDQSRIEQFSPDDDALTQSILKFYKRENVYLESFRNEKTYSYFVVRLVELSGKLAL